MIWRTHLRHWLAWPLCTQALLLGLGSSALAATKAHDRRVQEARVQCMAGSYQEGVRILAELYVQTLDPNFVYNQGRCYEQNGKNEQAILRFEEYLRVSPNLSASDVDEVQARIAGLRSASERNARPSQPEMPKVAPAETVPVPAPPPSERLPQLDLQSAPAPEPAPASPIYKRWWFWTGIGAVVVGSVVTTILLRPKDGASSPSCDPGVPCVRP